MACAHRAIGAPKTPQLIEFKQVVAHPGTMSRRLFLCLACLVALFAGCRPDLPSSAQARSRAEPQADHGLPPEAIETLAIIRRGGPFPYRKDGTIFHNRERRLPQNPVASTASTPFPHRAPRHEVRGAS